MKIIRFTVKRITARPRSRKLITRIPILNMKLHHLKPRHHKSVCAARRSRSAGRPKPNRSGMFLPAPCETQIHPEQKLRHRKGIPTMKHGLSSSRHPRSVCAARPSENTGRPRLSRLRMFHPAPCEIQIHPEQKLRHRNSIPTMKHRLPKHRRLKSVCAGKRSKSTDRPRQNRAKMRFTVKRITPKLQRPNRRHLKSVCAARRSRSAGRPEPNRAKMRFTMKRIALRHRLPNSRHPRSVCAGKQSKITDRPELNKAKMRFTVKRITPKLRLPEQKSLKSRCSRLFLRGRKIPHLSLSKAKHLLSAQ